MAKYSSYIDPISDHGDREKPEVVSVGSRVLTTRISSPWIGYSGAGTSMATASVSGEAALLMQRKSQLTSWPEAVKAIIMASAIHNIENASRLSEFDGAGAVDCSIADDTANNNRWFTNTVVYSDFPKTYVFNVPTAGKKVRVVISWDSHPPNENYVPVDDRLEADLDLEVYNPSGTRVASSVSYDNNYEICEFTAAATGNYQAVVLRNRFDGTSERLALAYSIS